MDWQALYEQHQGQMEDFWARRMAAARFTRPAVIFGRPLHLSSNHEPVLAALDHSLPLFSRTSPQELPPFQVQIVVWPGRVPPGEPPADLMNHTTYTGSGRWLMIDLAAWGQAHVDLDAGTATLVLVPELADRPRLVSHALLNTILLNLCLGSGMGMLHAACLVRDGRVLLLLARHNTGKSTTALHLVLEGGYRLLTESMVHVLPDEGAPLLAGFPVGQAKLREDMLARFPQLHPLLRPEPVRQEIKYTFDLRDLDPALVETDAIAAEQVELCLLSRSGRQDTRLHPAALNTVWAAIMENSLFYDSAAAWERNLAQIERVVSRARPHHLEIGRDPAGIVRAVNDLWSRP